MSLVEHLEELRTRIIRILVILLVFFGVCYALSSQLSELLLTPLRNVLEGSSKIVFTGLLDKVLAELQIAFWCSVVLSSPLWFREIWLFIKPGLYENEVRYVRPFIFVGFVLFILGVCFGYFLIFPFTFKTLINFGVGGVDAMIGIKDYLLLSSKVLVFLGILFQLPNILIILGFMGLVTKYSLREIRKYVYVIFAILSAVLTPPDVISLLCVWIPMALLYELGILAVAMIVHPYLKRKYLPQ